MKACSLWRLLLSGVLLLPFVSRAGNGGPISSNVPLNEISVRAYRYFHTTWPSIRDEVWYKTDKAFIVSFKNDAHRKKAFFNLRGVFLYSMEYYPGEDLSAEVAAVVLRKFPDHRIGIVTQVSNRGKTWFYVKIENGSVLRTLSIIDGKVEVCEELINSGAAGN